MVQHTFYGTKVKNYSSDPKPTTLYMGCYESEVIDCTITLLQYNTREMEREYK